MIDKRDDYSTIKSVNTCGSAKPSLTIVLLYGNQDDSGKRATVTVYGKTSLKKSDFVKDYERSGSY